MTVKILRWGNSASIRLSQPMRESAGPAVGGYCQVQLLDSRTAPVKGRSARRRLAGTIPHQNPGDEAVKPVWLAGDAGA